MMAGPRLMSLLPVSRRHFLPFQCRTNERRWRKPPVYVVPVTQTLRRDGAKICPSAVLRVAVSAGTRPPVGTVRQERPFQRSTPPAYSPRPVSRSPIAHSSRADTLLIPKAVSGIFGLLHRRPS